MSKQELSLFQAEMSDVRPLPASDQIESPRRSRPDLAQLARRDAAIARPQRDSNPLTLPDAVPEVGPLDIVGEKKNGVQEGVYRKLRLGKYEIQARLDLHRITTRDARVMVHDFLTHSFRHGLRTLLITHGKGNGRMKSHVMHWMLEADLVLAWHSAKPPHGGTGATYVLLRKSPDDSRRTREEYGG
ncbi:DNA endonuclease SmrA [Isoalcanivorax beigongshangi]|uniref:DNA endonuclease SmrA n=1 Tax=Isoalcanivorax beigongshangi TaxID=3238810 RepID=A0ABV4AFI4_9GAMM